MICRALLVLLALAGSASAGCPSGWFPFGGFCYYTSVEQVPWKEARSVCRSMGTELVSIADEAENSDMGRINHHWMYIWIGLNDNVREGDFVWSDGSIGNYTNWRPGQPDGGSMENCVFIDYDSEDYHLKWSDQPCTKTHNFMCKTEELSTSSSAQSDIAGAE